MSLVGGTVIHGTTGLDLAWITVVIQALAGVVVPAVWSRRGYRRRAGRGEPARRRRQ